MTDTERVSHEDVERVIETAPADLITRLPDCVETRAAKRNLAVAADYLHQAVEKSPRDRECP